VAIEATPTDLAPCPLMAALHADALGDDPGTAASLADAYRFAAALSSPHAPPPRSAGSAARASGPAGGGTSPRGSVPAQLACDRGDQVLHSGQHPEAHRVVGGQQPELPAELHPVVDDAVGPSIITMLVQYASARSPPPRGRPRRPRAGSAGRGTRGTTSSAPPRWHRGRPRGRHARPDRASLTRPPAANTTWQTAPAVGHATARSTDPDEHPPTLSGARTPRCSYPPEVGSSPSSYSRRASPSLRMRGNHDTGGADGGGRGRGGGSRHGSSR
jgi:hypothetical protein